MLGRVLDARDLGIDLRGRLGGRKRQVLHLLGDDGEAAPGLAGPRCLDRRIERQHIGLRGDVADEHDAAADLFRGLGEAAHGFLRLVGRTGGMARNSIR